LVGVCSSSAFAKITIFSNEEALSRLLSSDAYGKELKTLGTLNQISIQQSAQDNIPVYTFNLTYTTQTPVGQRSCFAKAIVPTESVRSPQGIMSTVLGEAKVIDLVCEP